MRLQLHMRMSQQPGINYLPHPAAIVNSQSVPPSIC